MGGGLLSLTKSASSDKKQGNMLQVTGRKTPEGDFCFLPACAHSREHTHTRAWPLTCKQKTVSPLRCLRRELVKVLASKAEDLNSDPRLSVPWC